MAKSEEDWNGFRYEFLKYCWAEQFSKLILLACNFTYIAQKTHWVVMNWSYGFVF